MQRYTEPKMHTPNGENSVWYISYYFTDSITGQKRRYRETGDVNRIKNKRLRKSYLRALKDARANLLLRGWTPTDGMPEYRDSDSEKTYILDALDKAVSVKRLVQSERAHSSFKNRIELFKKYLYRSNLAFLNVKEISRKHISDYLEYRLLDQKVSSRTRNNDLIDLKSAFNVLVEKELIEKNPCLGVKKIPQQTEMHEDFTKEELKRIFDYVNEHDNNLGLFIKLIYYSGLRPIEATRIKLSYINLEKRCIQMPVGSLKDKNSLQLKIINDSIVADLLKLEIDKYPKDYFLFSALGKPSITGTTRDYITDKVKKVKTKLGLPENKTLYGFKHTFVSLLLEKQVPHIEIMKITGHKTLSSFQVYARRFLTDLPNDYSNLYDIRF